jgi:hypothetical protein
VRVSRVRLPQLLPTPVLAAAIVGLGLLIGWKGVDLPAQLYRVTSFRAHGWAIWDNQWFGGHWTLDYSVLFPALAGVVGVATVTVAAAALAALAFERLATAHLGAGARPAALVFALGTVVQSAIGQLPFLAGESLGLCACWAASRNRWAAAALLALGASLISPLAGAFIGIAIVGWALPSAQRAARALPSAQRAARALARWPDRHHIGSLAWAAVVVLAGVAPSLVGAVLFPGQGAMPYPGVDFAWELGIAGALWLAAGRPHPPVRRGIAIFAVAATASFLVPSPVGGNIGRLEDVLALPLAVGLLWTRGRAVRRFVLPAAAIPLALSQFGPAWSTLTSGGGQPSTQRAYFTPLLTALERLGADQPTGRVEVVPTKFHWEAAYVAPTIPLARGWERQLDEGDNPLFYADSADLDPTTYRAWLIDDGVRFVALADAPLDYAGAAEARLVEAGVPGLQLAWHSAHWRVYRVDASTGIVATPARLVSESGSRVVVTTPQPGSVLVRIRYNPNWRLSAGAGCIAPAPASMPGGGTWLRVVTPVAERFSLGLSLLPGNDACPLTRWWPASGALGSTG